MMVADMKLDIEWRLIQFHLTQSRPFHLYIQQIFWGGTYYILDTSSKYWRSECEQNRVPALMELII